MEILVAEDNAASRLLIQTSLTKWGYSVLTASNGEEALEALQKKDHPKILILDWVMPKLEGPDVCEQVRKLNEAVPTYIIMLTIRDSKEDLVQGLEAGADDYITKPFDKNELRARISVAERMIGLQQSLQNKIEALEASVEHVKTLQSLLPICVHCHSIRTDDQAWERLENYLETHSNVRFSHGVCPACKEKFYSPPAIG